MKTYDFVHLVLYAAEGQIKGRTKLQKTVYFAGALSGMLENLGYRAHFFGPYSGEVAAAVDELRGLGFLDQNISSGGAINPQGFEIARYDYSLTEDGKEVAELKAEENPEIWKKIKKAIQKLKKAKADDYVQLSYAAKAYFMIRKTKQPYTAEDLARMTPQFGWKVDDEQMKRSTQLLVDLGLIPKKPSKT